VKQNDIRVIRRLPYHINDRLFASALVDEYVSIAASHGIKKGAVGHHGK